MGPASDAQAVVDSFGCSHHLDNLAVADASIMPWVPRANTNLTAIMSGEKIGEWIRTRPGIYGLYNHSYQLPITKSSGQP
jgi:choline dehydrogenase